MNSMGGGRLHVSFINGITQSTNVAVSETYTGVRTMNLVNNLMKKPHKGFKIMNRCQVIPTVRVKSKKL